MYIKVLNLVLTSEACLALWALGIDLCPNSSSILLGSAKYETHMPLIECSESTSSRSHGLEHGLLNIAVAVITSIKPLTALVQFTGVGKPQQQCGHANPAL